jgi:hypothetical protein
MAKLYQIKAFRDPEGVWLAECEELPGLLVGADTVDALMDKLPGALVDMIEEHEGRAAEDVSYELRIEPVALKSAA